MSALLVQRRKGEASSAILSTSVLGRSRRKVPLRAFGAIRDDRTFWRPGWKSLSTAALGTAALDFHSLRYLNVHLTLTVAPHYPILAS